MLNRLLHGSRALTYVLAMALMLTLTACDDDSGGGMDPDPDPDPDPELLSDILQERDDLTTLFSAVEASGQLNLTEDPDADITVFAPNNSAFANIEDSAVLDEANSDTLEAIVQYHVLPQSVLSSGLSEGPVPTASGDNVRVTRDDQGNFLINGNSITAADLEADNGVLHVIDGLLLENRALATRLALTTPTRQLALEAQRLGAAESLGTLENATLFAPRNIQDAIAESGLDLSDEQLTSALLYHVVDAEALVQDGVLDEAGPIDSETLIGLLEGSDSGEITVPTEQGEDLTIAQEDDEIVFNNGQATLDQSVLDKFTDNFANVFHVIDGVLLPPSIVQGNADAISYDLAAQSNDGAIPGGVNGTATFWRYGDAQTLVTLELTDGATGASVSHPAHIHNGSAAEGGSIEYYLTPIDGSDEGASSARVIDVPFDELTSFDGYINIHESVANLGAVVSQGNIGANASGMMQEGLDLVDGARSTEYDLAANANEGSVAPDGIPATATFQELTSSLTLVTLDIGLDGATGASVSHPAHIHNGSAAEGGSIEYYLGPIDGSDPASRSSKLVAASYDELTSFDGYINIHESLANLGAVVSQGNIGANAGLVSIADARTLEDEAEVTIQGTLTRAKGRYLFLQDNTAGLVLFDFDGFNDQLDAGDLAIGDEIRIDGRMDTFNEQRQIRIDDDAFGIEVLSSGNELPDVPTITLNELNTNPEDYIHQLVRVENFTINPDGDTEFQAGGGDGNYDIDDGTATSVLRLEGSNSSEYEGEPIPEGEVTFEGAVTQYQGTYQLHLALESDLILE